MTDTPEKRTPPIELHDAAEYLQKLEDRIRELETENERLQKCREDSIASEANVIRQRDEARSLIGQIPPSMIRNMSAPLKDALMRHGAKTLQEDPKILNLSGITRTELLEAEVAKLRDLCKRFYQTFAGSTDGEVNPTDWLAECDSLLAEAREMLGDD